MAQITGNKYVLVVIVNTNDHAFNPSKYATFVNKAATVSDDVFGSGSDIVNMASQFAACSFGALDIIPEPNPKWISQTGQTFSTADLLAVEAAPGVVEVDIGIDIDGPSESEIRNAFYSTAITKMDENNLKGLTFPGPFDHVIYVRHACYGSCGWAACEYPNFFCSRPRPCF